MCTMKIQCFKYSHLTVENNQVQHFLEALDRFSISWSQTSDFSYCNVFALTEINFPNDKILNSICDFQAILSTLGGPGEKIRAEKFLERVKVVPDQISDKVKNLKCGGKVRERSKVIFGTGDALKVVTVSANTGFVRAAQSQNIDLAVISHEPRALTEDKMKTARKIE